jgi:putative tryptophan/tyrosine transport system substrate-binding protein
VGSGYGFESAGFYIRESGALDLKVFFASMLCSFLFFGTPVFAHEILVLQSFKTGPFDDALRGFKTVCRSEMETVIVSDRERFDFVKTVREVNPRLILAIGAGALKQAIKISNTPIIYLMVLNPEEMIRGRENVTGVRMIIPPEKYLDVMEKLNLPRLKIGIIYDPAHSYLLMKRIMQAAVSRGIDITAKEVRKPKDVPDMLERMKGSFNLFWMLPDPSVVTADTVEYLLLFTQQYRVPIVTFADKYLQMGAMISLDIDSFDLGKQGGEIANRIIAGGKISDIPYTSARKPLLRVNHKIATKLGINLNSLGSSVQTEMDP